MLFLLRLKECPFKGKKITEGFVTKWQPRDLYCLSGEILPKPEIQPNLVKQQTRAVLKGYVCACAWEGVTLNPRWDAKDRTIVLRTPVLPSSPGQLKAEHGDHLPSPRRQRPLSAPFGTLRPQFFLFLCPRGWKALHMPTHFMPTKIEHSHGGPMATRPACPCPSWSKAHPGFWMLREGEVLAHTSCRETTGRLGISGHVSDLDGQDSLGVTFGESQLEHGDLDDSRKKCQAALLGLRVSPHEGAHKGGLCTVPRADPHVPGVPFKFPLGCWQLPFCVGSQRAQIHHQWTQHLFQKIRGWVRALGILPLWLSWFLPAMLAAWLVAQEQDVQVYSQF